MAADSNAARFDTLCPDRTVESSRKENSKGRKTYQRGVFLDGKNKDKWGGRYREDVVGMNGEIQRIRRYVGPGRAPTFPNSRPKCKEQPLPRESSAPSARCSSGPSRISSHVLNGDFWPEPRMVKKLERLEIA